MSSKLGVENIAHTNGTNAMTISSGGVATLPQIPCCYVKLTTSNATVSHGYNGVDNQHVPITTFYLGECVVNDYFTVQLTGGQIFINTSGEYSAFSVKLVG